MGSSAMAFSASFTIGGLITYWAIDYHRTGFHLSSAAVVWLSLGVLAFVASTLAHRASRTHGAFETSDEAIQRQVADAREKAKLVHEDSQ